jgi:hypothetical protein
MIILIKKPRYIYHMDPFHFFCKLLYIYYKTLKLGNSQLFLFNISTLGYPSENNEEFKLGYCSEIICAVNYLLVFFKSEPWYMYHMDLYHFVYKFMYIHYKTLKLMMCYQLRYTGISKKMDRDPCDKYMCVPILNYFQSFLSKISS